jgi:heme/copper-type cytochrome/quinol oxidase subunit 4
MEQIGKLVLLAGAALVVVGGVLWILGRLGFGGLPGDIRYESDRVKVYFPVVTCLVVSIILSLIIWVWRRMTRG